MNSPILIRPERAEDYAAIAAVNASAFEHRAAEAVIVALHRHRQDFDPELSLVAETGGRIVGHVLFSPHTIRLLGQDVRAVNLAPIAVDPAFQRQGIGGRLIEAGHAAARQKGFALAYLLGHTTYYPRFGYRTHAYGACELAVPAAALTGLAPQSTLKLEVRPPMEADVPALQTLWRQAEGAVDFAIEPGPNLMDWISPNPAIAAQVYLQEGAIAGYTRHRDPLRPIVFLAADEPAARAMAVHLVELSTESDLVLPLHPASPAAGAFPGAIFSSAAWGAGMALSLAPNPFDDYYAQVRNGKRPVGRPIWGVEFELE